MTQGPLIKIQMTDELREVLHKRVLSLRADIVINTIVARMIPQDLQYAEVRNKIHETLAKDNELANLIEKETGKEFVIYPPIDMIDTGVQS